jgi:hypothetical protein
MIAIDRRAPCSRCGAASAAVAACRENAGDIEQVINDLCLPCRVGLDGIDRPVASTLMDDIALQQICSSDQRVERRPECMRNHREELSLHPVGISHFRPRRAFACEHEPEIVLGCFERRLAGFRPGWKPVAMPAFAAS